MSLDIDKLFDGMARAEIFGKGNYLEDGIYTVEMRNIFAKEGHKGKSFICEFTILESSNAANPPGSSGSWVLNFSNKYAFGTIAELVLALLGYENTRENQTDPTIRKQVELVARAVCGSETAQKELGADYEDGMLLGIRVKLETTKRATQPTATKPAGTFTAHKWSPIPDVAAVEATAAVA